MERKKTNIGIDAHPFGLIVNRRTVGKGKNFVRRVE
jgi:hypothetical protein